MVDQELRKAAAAAMTAQLPHYSPADFQDAWKRAEKRIIGTFEKPGRGQAKRQAKVFEVHHAIEHAREHFMRALVTGHSPKACDAAATAFAHV